MRGHSSSSFYHKGLRVATCRRSSITCGSTPPEIQLYARGVICPTALMQLVVTGSLRRLAHTCYYCFLHIRASGTYTVVTFHMQYWLMQYFGLHVLLWHVIVTIAATSRIRELPLLVIRCPFCDYHHCHHHHQRLCEHYVVSSVLARLCFCML